MTKKYFLLVSVCVFLMTMMRCQYDELHLNTPIARTFEKVVEQQEFEVDLRINKVILANDGGYIMIGYKASKLLSIDDVVGFWIKLNEKGEVLNYREFGVSNGINGSVIPFDIIASNDGYSIVGGNHFDYGLTYIFIQEDGKILVNSNFFPDFLTYPTNYLDYATNNAIKIIDSNDGNYLVGVSNFLIKLDVAGKILWDNNEFTGIISDIIKGPNNGYYVAQLTPLFPPEGQLNFVDAEGNIQQSSMDFNIISHFPIQIEQLPNTNIVASGVQTPGQSTPFGVPSVYLSKVQVKTLNNESVWETDYENMTINSLQVTEDGGILLCGSTTNNYAIGSVGGNVFLLKLTANGTEEWRRFYGGDLEELGQSAVQLPDGGYFVAGTDVSISATDFFPGDKGIYLIRTNREGEL